MALGILVNHIHRVHGLLRQRRSSPVEVEAKQKGLSTSQQLCDILQPMLIPDR
jgi:hypothetical protein